MNVASIIQIAIILLIGNANSAESHQIARSRILRSDVSIPSRHFWEDFSRRFQLDVERHFLTHAGTSLYEFPIRRNDPHIQFLEELGFIFPKSGTSSVKTYYVPPLLDMLEKLQLKIQENIDRGLLKPEDALFPKMVVSAIRVDQVDSFRKDPRNLNKALNPLFQHIIDPGGNLPGNETYIENSEDHETSNLLPITEFYRLIDSGYFPIGGLRYSTGTYRSNNEILHDLAHWSSMIQYPDLMKAVKKNARKKLMKDQTVQEKSVWDETLEFMAYEGLITVSPKSRADLPHYLGLESLLKQKPRPTLAELEHYYKTLSLSEVSSIKYRINASFEDHFELIGGAARDLTSGLTVPDRQFLYRGFMKKAADYHSPTSFLAAYSYFVLITRNWNPVDWFSFLLSENTEQSPIRSMILKILEP